MTRQDDHKSLKKVAKKNRLHIYIEIKGGCVCTSSVSMWHLNEH